MIEGLFMFRDTRDVGSLFCVADEEHVKKSS